MKKYNRINLGRDIVDVKGWTIPSGTTLYVLSESTIHNPMTKEDELWRKIKVDNGTGDLALMTETAWKEVL